MRQVDKQQLHLVVGYPGTTVRSKDRHVLELAGAVLSGQGGRLFVRLRDQLGLAYRLTAFSQEGIEPGHFAAHVATKPSRLNEAIDGIRREVRRLRDELVAPEELRRAQRYLVGTHQVSLQRRAVLASHVAFDELYGLGHSAYRRYAQEMEAISRRRLREVACRYLDESRAVVAIVHPRQLSSST